MGVAKHTVEAAKERRDRYGEELGAETDEHAQQALSQPLYRKAASEDRDPGEAPGTV